MKKAALDRYTAILSAALYYFFLFHVGKYLGSQFKDSAQSNSFVEGCVLIAAILSAVVSLVVFVCMLIEVYKPRLVANSCDGVLDRAFFLMVSAILGLVLIPVGLLLLPVGFCVLAFVVVVFTLTVYDDIKERLSQVNISYRWFLLFSIILMFLMLLFFPARKARAIGVLEYNNPPIVQNK